MTLDQILHEIRTGAGLPTEALRAGVGQADALAPLVYVRVAQFCRGVCLLPEDESLLFCGLHVLAAARHAELWPRLVDLARAPEGDIAELFMDHAPISLPAMMLGVWDGDVDALLRLIELADLSNDGRWALFELLARLTFDGRIPRDVTHAFLERYERDGLADPDSLDWWGWENAVTRLGLVELEPALQRTWEKPAYASFDGSERAESLAALRKAAASPADPAPFEEAGIVPVTDPAAALAWVEARAALSLRRTSEPVADDDPAREMRLTHDQQLWLARFLASRQVPATTMSLELLDGFLTAVYIGPSPVPIEALLAMVWGEENDRQEPDWADEEQRKVVHGLIARMGGAILLRCSAGAPHVPLIREIMPLDDAADWAEGFALGLELGGETAWQPLFADERGAEEGLEVLALCEGEEELLGREATPEERTRIIGRLPKLLQRIAAFWRDPQHRYPRGQPLRVQKIGRNDPCPCGSGKKYKRCCALNPPPTLN